MLLCGVVAAQTETVLMKTAGVVMGISSHSPHSQQGSVVVMMTGAGISMPSSHSTHGAAVAATCDRKQKSASHAAVGKDILNMGCRDCGWRQSAWRSNDAWCDEESTYRARGHLRRYTAVPSLWMTFSTCTNVNTLGDKLRLCPTSRSSAVKRCGMQTHDVLIASHKLEGLNRLHTS